MAKRKPDRGILGTLVDVITNSTISNVKHGASELMGEAHRKALILQERLVQRFSIAITMCVAALLLLAGVMYFLIEDLLMRKSQAFVLAALVLLALTFILKYRMLRQELRR